MRGWVGAASLHGPSLLPCAHPPSPRWDEKGSILLPLCICMTEEDTPQPGLSLSQRPVAMGPGPGSSGELLNEPLHPPDSPPRLALLPPTLVSVEAPRPPATGACAGVCSPCKCTDLLAV